MMFHVTTHECVQLTFVLEAFCGTSAEKIVRALGLKPVFGVFPLLLVLFLSFRRCSWWFGMVFVSLLVKQLTGSPSLEQSEDQKGVQR